MAKAFAGVATPDLVFRLLFALLVTVPSYRPKGVIVKAKNGVMGGHHTHMRTPSPTTHRRDPLLCSKIRQRYQRCGICVSLTTRIGSSAPCSCGSIWVCGGSDHFPRSCGSYRCTSTAAALRQWWEIRKIRPRYRRIRPGVSLIARIGGARSCGHFGIWSYIGNIHFPRRHSTCPGWRAVTL